MKRRKTATDEGDGTAPSIHFVEIKMEITDERNFDVKPDIASIKTEPISEEISITPEYDKDTDLNDYELHSEIKCENTTVDTIQKEDQPNAIESESKSIFEIIIPAIRPGEKRPCPICGKEFTLTAYLYVHMAKHSEPHSCKICKRTFRHEHLLKNHEIRHISDKQYTCEECDIKFVVLADLKRHRKGHRDIQFSCSYCGMQFPYRYTLLDHEKLHTHGEHTQKEFACKVCGKTFTNKRRFIKHESIHNKEKLYECDLCHKKLSYKKSLVSHFKAHAKMK